MHTISNLSYSRASVSYFCVHHNIASCSISHHCFDGTQAFWITLNKHINSKANYEITGKCFEEVTEESKDDLKCSIHMTDTSVNLIDHHIKPLGVTLYNQPASITTFLTSALNYIFSSSCFPLYSFFL